MFGISIFCVGIQNIIYSKTKAYRKNRKDILVIGLEKLSKVCYYVYLELYEIL